MFVEKCQTHVEIQGRRQVEGKLPFKYTFEEVVQGKYIHIGNCLPLPHAANDHV